MWLHGVIFLACLALVGNGYGCGSSHFLNSGFALPSVSTFLTQAVGLTPEFTFSQHQVCFPHFLYQVGSAPLQSLTFAPNPMTSLISNLTMLLALAFSLGLCIIKMHLAFIFLLGLCIIKPTIHLAFIFLLGLCIIINLIIQLAFIFLLGLCIIINLIIHLALTFLLGLCTINIIIHLALTTSMELHVIN